MRLSVVGAIILSLVSSTAFALDTDGDGLDDADEITAGSNPAVVDSDADGISDGREVHFYGTSPAATDSDGDGEWDLAEIFLHGTDPTDPADAASSPAGNGTFQYWLDVTDKVDNETAARAALAQTSYQRIRSFLWSDFIDFAGPDEPGEFPIDDPYFDVLGGDFEDYAGAATAWLYIEPRGGPIAKSIAVGAADGWILDVWDGGQTQTSNHDGGGFKAEALRMTFGAAGGMFPMEIVTWEDKDKESFEVTWFDGDQDYDENLFELMPHSVQLAADIRVRQYALDVNGGSVEQGDIVQLTVEIDNAGAAAAYALDVTPMLSSNVSFAGFTDAPPATTTTGQVATVPFVDAQTTVRVVYEVRVDDVGAATVRAEVWGDAFPSLYPIGEDRIRVLSDDPLVDETTDTANRPVGYFGDGATDDDPNVISIGETIDVDQCATGTDTCDANATCEKILGGYTCTCGPGYQGDGFTCTDIDECTNGTAGCGANASCTNTPGSFDCACDAGYAGDGVTCTDVDECADGSDDCDANATCTNTAGGFECECDDGYTGDGRACTALECACSDDQVCLEGECFDSCVEDADCTDPGHRCYDERCAADPCDGIECEAGEVCAGGSCFLQCDGDVDCTNPDDLCYDGRCAVDPCEGFACGSSQTCWGGSCFDRCAEEVDCSNPDDLCFDGRCTDEACRGIACGSEQVCWGGSCFEACEGDVDCSSPSATCYDELRCAQNPCEGVQCPTTQVCAAGYCRTTCVEDAECPGAPVCDRGICTAPSPEVPEEGCGCSSARHGAGTGWLAVLLLGLLRLGWRRRRATHMSGDVS